MDAVQAWSEQVTIPTYEVGEPEKNPMFLEKRVYQGSSGRVYPHPVIDRVSDEKHEKAYTAVFLENRYLKVMILPELGGRVQMAIDKTNDYHFVYYNRVIKPALVGLCGPWISGGIEFNWPQHHRPSTFLPVDYRIEEHGDGSRTVWCSEIERMFRTKGSAGFTLYPGRAYLEVRGRVYNRTDVPQTFLWWANPAVHVDENYQAIFPPDVQAVMDHGKRDVSDFPIATGTYYKVDYAPGTDISWYKNIPVPTSYMAYHSDFDFVGGYDHGKEAGILHIANHHISPGKKLWTWGAGDFGRVWNRHLTDEDGPYVELMCGVYTDNQPDFAWIMPGEEKRFTQVFLPYKQVGRVSNANREAVLRLEVDGDRAHLGVYVTRPREVTVRLLRKDESLYEHAGPLTPEAALLRTVELPATVAPPELSLQVWEDESLIAEHTPRPEAETEIPDPATPAPPPQDVDSNEELFLHGLHLEQYRHATYEPEPYYEEAIRRDPGDSRCHNALGRLLYGRGKFAEAEVHFRRAIERLTMRNPNPYEGEPFYNLGLTLRMQERYDEAYAAFYKATWNEAWKAPAYFELARIACRRGAYEEALDLVERALARNRHHHKARHLKIIALRQKGRADAARAEARQSLALDSTDVGALYERTLLENLSEDESVFTHPGRDDVHTCIELALDYVHAGQLAEADRVLDHAPPDTPMVTYYQGWVRLQQRNEAAADACFAAAASMDSSYCFPHRIECVPALQAAMARRPEDARTPYYIGNFWYAHRCYDEAITAWERARTLDPSFATVHRNLGLAYMNKRDAPEKARASMERAFTCDPSDARVLYELDQLYKEVGEAPAHRLDRLDVHPDLVAERDDLTIERVTLLNQLGRYEGALDVLMGRTFHPWEGGEGKVTGQYVISLVELAREALDEAQYDDAIALLKRAQTYPPNLGEGKLSIATENRVFYYLGCAYAGNGEEEEARRCFEKAATGRLEPTASMYYNDQPPELMYYQGLARRALGARKEADEIFERLVAYGTSHLDDEVQMDYFAVSLPDFLVFDQDLERRNRIHCCYMAGLGYLGLGRDEAARKQLDRVLELEPSHQGATLHRDDLLQHEQPTG